tara:strand:+ start:179 stop:886 length:708 start_codon:yes stop_codon:yes gene_type:complete
MDNSAEIEEQQKETEEIAKWNKMSEESKTDPDYNYISKTPTLLEYRKKGTMFDTANTIEDNLTRSAGILITGKEDCPDKNVKKDLRMGTLSYFTSGVCGKNSSPECIDKPRNIIVDNLAYHAKDNQGLIPSIINDFMSFEPVEVMRSMNGSGYIVNDKCSMKNVTVTHQNPGSAEYKRDVQLCVSDITQPVINNDDVINEGFTNQTSSNDNIGKWLIPIILVCLLLSYQRSKNIF